jgi:hypothetical protein
MSDPQELVSAAVEVPKSDLLDRLSTYVVDADQLRAARAAYGAFQLKLLQAERLADADERAAAKAAVHDALVQDAVQVAGDSSKEETLNILQGSVGQLLHVKLQMSVSCRRVVRAARSHEHMSRQVIVGNVVFGGAELEAGGVQG